MSKLDFVRHHYDVAGFRGVILGSCHRIAKFPPSLKVRPPGFRSVVNLRLGTSDGHVYQEVMGGEYDFPLGFDPKVILDVGANIGITSIWFANRFPQSKIYAVEAERSNFEQLAHNVKSYPSITPIHAALWNKNGTIVVSNPTDRHGGHYAFVTRDKGEGEKIRAMTMKTLMQEFLIETIDIAKIDIEGAEIEVFEDTGWLQKTRSVMIELHDRFRPGCSEAIDRAMTDFENSRHGMTSFYLRNRAT